MKYLGIMGDRGKKRKRNCLSSGDISKTKEQFLLGKISIHFRIPETVHNVEQHVGLKVEAKLLASVFSVIHYLLLLSWSH